MKRVTSIIGIVAYIITAILTVFSLITGYDMVSRNLDGGYNLTGNHALVFAFICIIIIAGCLTNSFNLYKQKGYSGAIGTGLFIVAVTIVMFYFAATLPGNVDTEVQYLMLRTAQGFETTNIFLIITSGLGFLSVLLQKFSSNK